MPVLGTRALSSYGRVIPVILSGGSGTRLWPLSRKSHPKPFVPLPDGQSLAQKTLERVLALDGVGPILTITNRDYYFLTRDSYAACRQARTADLRYLLEPVGRNTAPAMAAAALWAQSLGQGEAVLLFLPADHVITDTKAFSESVDAAAVLAEAGLLATFGIVPDRPETGFGYIEPGEVLQSGGYRVRRFIEKPDRERALELLGAGRVLWNSGMFSVRAATLLDGLRQQAPEVLSAAEKAWDEARKNGDTVELGASFAQAPNVSVDYALMEKASNAAVLPASFSWSDVGAWRAYGDFMETDATHNQVWADEILAEDSDHCVIYSRQRLVALLGVKDLLVVDTPDVLMVADKRRDQEVKGLVDRLSQIEHESVDTHVTVHRPWGIYTVLEEGEHFKIKRIVVKPKAKLSLQMHYHRSEHWVVVSGTARVTVGTDERLVVTNESTFIPAGTMHRLDNPGVIDLVLIEVQSGTYLGEDDIVRFNDLYGRVETPPRDARQITELSPAC